MGAEIKETVSGLKYLIVAVVVVVVMLAVGNYALSAMQNTGVGNSTVYQQGYSVLNSINTQFANFVNIVLIVIIIAALAIIIRQLQSWA
jgi:hypothetical protein